MDINDYLCGCDVLGVTAVPDRYVVIKIKNVNEVVKNKAGSTGAFAMSLAPQTIESQVYDEVAKQIQKEFAKENIQVESKVVTAPILAGSKYDSEFFSGAFIGSVGTVVTGGVLWALWHFGIGPLIKR